MPRKPNNTKPMRVIAKPMAKIGLHKAVHYRSGLFSFASDLEAMVDAYGAENVSRFALLIKEQFEQHGTSLINASINNDANQLPMPLVRHRAPKQDKRRSKFQKAA